MEKQVKKFELPTGLILQAGLLVGGFLVGKKILEKVGVLKTAKELEEEKKATAIETGSIGNISQINLANPALALNPNYYNTIIDRIKIAKYKGAGIPITEYYKLANPGPYPEWNKSLDILIKNIYDSKGIFKDDMPKLYASFQACKNLLQVSLLSKYFYIQYKKDLFDFIKSYTNESEQAKLLDIIKNKPLY